LPQDWIVRLGDFDWGRLTSFKPDFLIGREVETSALDLTAASKRLASRSSRGNATPAPGSSPATATRTCG
jgi:hypothetical protein